MLTVFFNYETSLTCCSPFLWGILSILGKASGSFSLLRNRYNKGSSLLFPTPLWREKEERRGNRITLTFKMNRFAKGEEAKQQGKGKATRIFCSFGFFFGFKCKIFWSLFSTYIIYLPKLLNITKVNINQSSQGKFLNLT